MAEHQSAPRIITFSGPREGVGKTSICVNLALAWAAQQRRPVLIIPLDPLCRQEHSLLLGIQNPKTMVDVLNLVGKETLQAAGMLLKGKIPLSQWGVGVLPLSKRRVDTVKMKPDFISALLPSLLQSFDLFIDVDAYFPMQVFSFDISDKIFWVINSNANSLNATAAYFRDFNELHFPSSKFDIINNFCDMPGSLSRKEVDKFFSQMGKEILTYMPWEDVLPGLTNQNRILIAEQPNTQWISSLSPVLDKITELIPEEKEWDTTIDGADFAQSSMTIIQGEGVGVPGGRQTAQPSGRPSSAAGGIRMPGVNDKMPSWWDELKSKVHRGVVSALETQRIKISDDAAGNEETRRKVDIITNGILDKETEYPLSRDQRVMFINELIDEIMGLGPLESLMRDPSVSEIMVNAHDKIFIERKGKLVLTGIHFRDDDQVVQVMKRIVAPLGRRIDESVPLVDARLKDGSRVNAIIAPLAVSGPTLTIRRFSSRPLTDKELIRQESVSDECIKFLEACVRLRKDIIISGGTGTGKTTFLNMLSGYIPDGERIITVEDVAELRLLQKHWVRLESRPPNVEGKGQVTICDLVKNCLRMRPDRIVVGEVRGSEALDMLQAMNTGHEGSLATIHANTARDALTRLETMCLMAGADLPIWALREQIASAIHLIVQLTRFSDGTRKVTSVTEVTGREETQITIHEIFNYKQTGIDKQTGKVYGRFSATGTPPKFFADFATRGMDIPVSMFMTDEQKAAKGLLKR